MEVSKRMEHAMRKRVVLGCLFVGLVFVFVCGMAEAKPRISVVIRFDDYCTGSPTDAELRIFMAFAKRHIPLNVAVIPFVGAFPKEGQPDPAGLSEGKAWILKKLIAENGFEVLDHGYSHELANGNQTNSSEFCDRPYQEQYERMARGKRLLETMVGVKVTGFVPPWNTYDENTIRVAKACGMRTFSPGGPDAALQQKYGIPFVGCGAGADRLRQRVEDARKSQSKQVLVTGLFHSFEVKDFNEKTGRFTFAALEQVLDWLTAQPDVRVVRIADAAKLVRREMRDGRSGRNGNDGRDGNGRP
jgi:peptidoglycan/xylan/chitin deacetylase (PgdA/CDA1 family)